jgi:hypothetical protein
MEQYLNYYLTAASIVGTFALIASITPTKKDDTIVGYLTQLIDFLGANFFKAKNE